MKEKYNNLDNGIRQKKLLYIEKVSVGMYISTRILIYTYERVPR